MLDLRSNSDPEAQEHNTGEAQTSASSTDAKAPGNPVNLTPAPPNPRRMRQILSDDWVQTRICYAAEKLITAARVKELILSSGAEYATQVAADRRPKLVADLVDAVCTRSPAERASFLQAIKAIVAARIEASAAVKPVPVTAKVDGIAGPDTCFEDTIRAGRADFVTVTTAADGRLMTKIHYVDSEGQEKTLTNDRGYLFNFSKPPVTCLDDLAQVLDGLDQHSCVIYGRLIEGTRTPCQRLFTTQPVTIEDAAHFWLLLDIDELPIEGEVFDPVAEPERAVEYIVARLPSEFHGARCLWRLTSSAGVKKSDTISMRLGFWLDRPITGGEAKAWLTGTIADLSIYTPNQPIYVATPVFKGGRTDPVARRSGIFEGRAATVPLGDIAPPAPRAVKVPKGLKAKAKVAPREAPPGVVFDTEAAIAVGRDVIERALASDEWKDPRKEAPTPTGARAYKLAACLKDEALSPEKIVDLLVEMVPSFDEEDRPLVEEMVESAFRRGQNDPACGSSNSDARLFGPIVDQWEAEIETSEEFWNRIIEGSQGAIQRMPEAPEDRAFSPEFTKEMQRIIEEDRAELARRLR